MELEPSEAVARVEASADVPPGGLEERFAGWGVMGLPYSNGHYLALRRFPASSLGEPYTAVWWRDPAGHWSIYSTAEPERSCARYFGRAVERTETGEILVRWPDSRSLYVSIPGVLDWRVELGISLATRMMSVMGAKLPRAVWRNPAALALTGRIAPVVLGTGRIRLQGTVPNGQWFQANPRQLWMVRSSTARLNGECFGSPAPLDPQTCLGDVWLPQRGIFFVGEMFLEAFDAGRHWSPALSSGGHVSASSMVAG